MDSPCLEARAMKGRCPSPPRKLREPDNADPTLRFGAAFSSCSSGARSTTTTTTTTTATSPSSCPRGGRGAPGGSSSSKKNPNTDEGEEIAAAEDVASVPGPERAGCAGATDAAAMSSTCCSGGSPRSRAEEGRHPPQCHVHAGGVTDDALRHFADAMALVDPSDRAGYEAALQRCPATVFEHECCPCYFLVACNSNPWDAAVRMGSYWRERIHLFEDRAFEPITLGSDVAPPTGLSEDDMKVLESGAVKLLPSDRDGRTVLFLDHSRLEPHMIEQYKSRLRVIWYMMQAGYRSGEPQAHKTATIVSMTRPPPSGKFSNGVWQYGAGAVRLVSALPVVTDAIHLLTLPVKFGTGRIVQLGLSVCATMLGSLFATLTKVHHGKRASDKAAAATNDGGNNLAGDDDDDDSTKASLFQQLKPHGFSRRGIPDVAGGLYTHDSFQSWLKRQRRVEKKVIWTEDQRVRQKRGVNRLHSQQKRQRRRQEFEELQEQVDQYEAANQQARLEHDRLERLLGAAYEAVGRFAAASVDDAAGRPRSFARPYSQSLGAWGPGGVAAAAQQPLEYPMSLSLLAALEPDPIAPSCLQKPPTLRAAPEFDASMYEALETWAVFQSPSDHASTHAMTEDLEPIELPRRMDSSVPMVPESSYPFPLPSPSDGLSNLSSLDRNFISEARGGHSARLPHSQYESFKDEDASRGVGGTSRESSVVSELSGPLLVQLEYLQRRQSSLRGQLDLPDANQPLLPPVSPPPAAAFGAHHAPRVISSTDRSSPLGNRGRAAALPPLEKDYASIMEQFMFKHGQGPAASPPQSSGYPSSSRNLPSGMDYSEDQRTPPSSSTPWPVDVLKDLRLDYSMDSSPLVDHTIFYDTLC